MNLHDILTDVKSNLRHKKTVLADEYDENGNLITIVRYDDKRASVVLKDIANYKTGDSLIDIEILQRLDYGNFKRLIDELLYYAN